MPMTTPLNNWTRLSSEQRRHAQIGIIGVGISWGLAALMAYSSPSPTRPPAEPATRHGLSTSLSTSERIAQDRAVLQRLQPQTQLAGQRPRM